MSHESPFLRIGDHKIVIGRYSSQNLIEAGDYVDSHGIRSETKKRKIEVAKSRKVSFESGICQCSSATAGSSCKCVQTGSLRVLPRLLPEFTDRAFGASDSSVGLGSIDVDDNNTICHQAAADIDDASSDMKLAETQGLHSVGNVRNFANVTNPIRRKGVASGSGTSSSSRRRKAECSLINVKSGFEFRVPAAMTYAIGEELPDFRFFRLWLSGGQQYDDIFMRDCLDDYADHYFDFSISRDGVGMMFPLKPVLLNGAVITDSEAVFVGHGDIVEFGRHKCRLKFHCEKSAILDLNSIVSSMFSL